MALLPVSRRVDTYRACPWSRRRIIEDGTPRAKIEEGIVKIVSWNVNGLRSVLQKGFHDFVAAADADILCLQETRALPEQVELELEGYEVHWNPAEKKGYSGTLVASRVPLAGVRRGLGVAKHDKEGRVLAVELPDFHLLTVYTPNSQHGLARLDYRVREWDDDFRAHVSALAKKKPVVFCGDLNVAHEEIDIANPRSNRRNAGFTDEERASFSRLLGAGFTDTFRLFCKEGGHYTWWSNFGRAREKNVGWRIDYFVVSADLAPRVVSSSIHPEVRGSDHCPISLVLG
jgi:exodeoxyribonuclease III